MTDLAGLQRKIDKLTKDIDTRKLVKQVALQAKEDVTKEIERDLGSDAKFSNWKPVLKAGFTLTSDTTADLKPRPSGPFAVLDQGRKRGAVAPKRKASKTYATPWGPRTYTKAKPLVLGPTKGKDTWKRATEEIKKNTPERVQKEVHKLLSNIFDGG